MKKTKSKNMKKKAIITFMNTLSRERETFIPLHKNEVRIYTCGPTVYAPAHIGNMRAYIFADLLRRILEYGGYKVKQVMNITDVGHLTSDADEGEDKLQKSAKEQKTTAWIISQKYTKQFLEDASKLNIQSAHILCKATEHIQEQINLIKELEKKMVTYRTLDGIYYDTSKFPEYGRLAKVDIKGLKAGKRIDMGEKRNKTDFAVWKFSKPTEKRDMEWESPWGKGFPGWHIECSAMSMKYLGNTFDIHTGGIDHIPIHHTNEIAQSEMATGKKFVNYWLHSEFLVLSSREKMSKSLGNIVTVNTLEEKGFDPLAYRYLCLAAHYRKRLLFGEKILEHASNAFIRLKNKMKELNTENTQSGKSNILRKNKYRKKFQSDIFDDLNTPRAVATMWELIKDNTLSDVDKYTLLLEFDKVFGLGLKDIKKKERKTIPQELAMLVKKREEYRHSKKWKDADKIREELEKMGYLLQDTKLGPHLTKKEGI